MLKNFDYKIISVMCMLMLSITSCVTGNDADSAKPATIRLSLGTGSTTKTVQTRTSGSIPSDNGANVGENEGTINTVCVGLFDADGNTITIHEYTYTNGQSESILTTTQVTQMIVEANVPSGLFTGATTISTFQSKVQQLSYTTSRDGLSNTGATTAGSQTMTALPMTSGIVSPLSLSGNGTTNKTVELTRVVARVSINNITTSFDSNGPYAGATFTPTEIFMYNVNDNYTWNGAASASATTVSGESTASKSFAYLGTGSTNYVSPSSTASQFFYVFPHSSTLPTKLVIKGTFTPSGGTAQTMYYPIVVNHAQSNTSFTDCSGNTTTNTDDAMIEANKAYNIAVTITGLGVTDPSKDIDPSAVTINSQVQDWTAKSVTVSFNDPDTGDYYFSDGSWGTLADHATTTVWPIGVIFSNFTSDIDKKHGWTHGYAMALTNAATNYATKTCIWGPATGENGETFTDTYGTYTYNWYSEESYSSFITDKDGYIETQAVKSNRTLSSSSYPAFYYALNYASSGTTYAAPSVSSGWYLPSIGQLYDIISNLGGITSVPADPTDVGYCYWYNSSLSGTDTYSYKCANSINYYLSAITTYSNTNSLNYSSPDLFSNSNMSYIDSNNNSGTYGGEVYWSSSEYTSNYAGYANFVSSGYLRLYNTNSKMNYYFRIRPVIAF